MTEIEAIIARHSVRSYQNKRIEPEKVKLLNEKSSELNKQGDFHLQFIENAGKTYNKLISKVLGLGSAPSVIACVGAETEDLKERIGYYGQQLEISYQNGKVTFRNKGGIFSKIDLGIVKYNF